MTAPEILVSGPDSPAAGPPRRAPRLALWLVVAVAAAWVGTQYAQDYRRHQAVELAADRVAVEIRVPHSALGYGPTVVVTVQVRGLGDPVRVDAPQPVPRDVGTSTVLGAPSTVGVDEGNMLLVRIRPDCARVAAVTAVAFEVPVTPASGRRHLLRAEAPGVVEVLRLACGLPLPS